MNISENNLREYANVYLKNGVLDKWRWYSTDPKDISHILHMKQINKETLSGEEIEYVRTLERVVIEGERHLEFINFTGAVQKFS